MTDEKVLQLLNLGVEFMTDKGPGVAVRGVNLDVRVGEIRGVVGESGCGKTVTAKAVMKLHDEKTTRYTGQILYKGQDLIPLSNRQMAKIRGKEIAYVFQQPMSAFDNLFTIGHQIEEVILQHLDVSRAQAREKCLDLLEAVGVTPAQERAKQYPYEFSGGMLQRTMIAMMIAADPTVLIADEATTALDVTMQARVLKLLKDIRDQRNISIMCITHNFGVVAEICDSVTVMFGGVAVECGLTGEIFDEPMHPYTQLLIENVQQGYTVTDTDAADAVPKAQGKPYDITQHLAGCAYQNRCPYATEKCRSQDVPILGDYEGHCYVCHYTPQERLALKGGGHVSA